MYYWWIVRIPVILIFPFLFYDLEIFFCVFSFIFLHLNIGLQSILNDYIHNQKTKIFLFILIKLCNFEFFRYSVELLI